MASDSVRDYYFGLFSSGDRFHSPGHQSFGSAQFVPVVIFTFQASSQLTACNYRLSGPSSQRGLYNEAFFGYPNDIRFSEKESTSHNTLSISDYSSNSAILTATSKRNERPELNVLAVGCVERKELLSSSWPSDTLTRCPARGVSAVLKFSQHMGCFLPSLLPSSSPPLPRSIDMAERVAVAGYEWGPQVQTVLKDHQISRVRFIYKSSGSRS